MSKLLPEEEAIIREECRILEEVLESLKKQCRRSSERLVTENKRARKLTADLVAARRDEDKQMLASDEAVSHALKNQFGSDVKTLSKLIEKPYFARIELEENDEHGRSRRIEYKIGFAANSDTRIIDWRKAPISKLYYEYKEGEEYSELIQGKERQGHVILRNQLDIEKGELRRITCAQGCFVHTNGEWQKLEHTGKSLREHYGRLPSILSLITKEQFQTITEDAETAVLIQGIAGSGKTTVALHRLSWLLHEDNSELKEEDCVIIVLSKSLKAYIQESLPALQIHNVPVQTLQDWAFSIIQNLNPNSAPFQRPADRCPASIGRLKRSFALLKALEIYARKQAEELAKYLSLRLPWESLPSGVRIIFDRELEKKKAPGILLEDLSQAITLALEKLAPSNPRAVGLHDARKMLAEEQQKLAKLPEDILALLSRPKNIIEYDDTKLIDAELINQAFERTKRNFEQGLLDPQDDALYIRLFELKYGGVPGPHKTVRRFGHIIVDEIQDLSPIDIENIIAAVSDLRKLTLVGDVQQRIDESSAFPGWDKLQDDLMLKDSIPSFVTLEVSHRSTLPIMRLADYVQKQKIVKEGRPGRVPIYFKCRSESHCIKTAVNWLKKAVEKYPTAITAVLCPNEEQARQTFKFLQPTFGPTVRLGTQDAFSFEEGILVTDVRQVKGLEFCNVLLWNPSKQSFPDTEISSNMLYVAVTRAEENLCIVAWQIPSPMLPSINSKLLRGVDLTIQDE